MTNQIVSYLLAVGGFSLGVLAGYGFGVYQDAARARYARRQDAGAFRSAWLVVPGSMTRIGLLLVLLSSFQLVFPLLFDGQAIQWLVSAGVVLGYGWTLYTQLRRRTAETLR